MARSPDGSKAWTQNTPQAQDQLACQLTARPLVARTSNPNEMRALTEVRSDAPVHTNTSPTPVILVVHVGAQALREVEEERQGGALWLVLTVLKMVSVSGIPTKMVMSQAANLPVKLRGGQWAEELEKVTASWHIEVLVPVTDDPKLVIAAGRLRTARDQIRRGVPRGGRGAAPGS